MGIIGLKVTSLISGHHINDAIYGAIANWGIDGAIANRFKRHELDTPEEWTQINVGVSGVICTFLTILFHTGDPSFHHSN